MTPPASLAAAIGQLSEYAATLSWDAQRPEARAAVRRVLRDSLAVLMAGGRLAEAQRRRAALPLSDGPATVFGADRTTGVCDAAWLNGCSLVGLELDEGNKTIRGHATAHVLPAVLALAEAGHLPGAAMAGVARARAVVKRKLDTNIDLRIFISLLMFKVMCQPQAPMLKA